MRPFLKEQSGNGRRDPDPCPPSGSAHVLQLKETSRYLFLSKIIAIRKDTKNRPNIKSTHTMGKTTNNK